MIPQIGHVTAKTLLAYCGSAEKIFSSTKSSLLKIPGIGAKIASDILSGLALKDAEDELNFIEKHKIQAVFITDKQFPQRLKNCHDCPVILYKQGDYNLNAKKVISIVGTRNATEYGKAFIEKLLQELPNYNPLIVSGLAYGIDAHAHKTALNSGYATVGVLAHGLDTIYPPLHRDLAMRMVQNQGGLLSEFPSNTKIERGLFPVRNRIIAGISDVVIVVESALKGGAIITAEIANGYNRDVFALPGAIHATFSRGCNFLIKSHKAHMIESLTDLEYIMRWNAEEDSSHVGKQKKLIPDLNESEKKIATLLQDCGQCDIDFIAVHTGIPVNVVASTLLNLEFAGLVRSLPGKKYTLL